MGEKAIQTFGLAAPSNDANTGDISQPLNSFVHMRDGLKEIQAQVGRSVVHAEYFFSCHVYQYLHICCKYKHSLK